MAKQKRRAMQANPQRSGPAPRRLGDQGPARPVSQGAARRSARRNKASSSRAGWIAVGLVVVVLAGFIIWRVSSGTSGASPGGVGSGQSAPLAPASIVNPVTHVTAAVFNSVGTGGAGVSFTVTKGQPKLAVNGLPQFVYAGALYCPYCALMRWSLIAALSRFGTFSGLKLTSSANDDGDIPTFSFHGASYTSPYLVFSPYETEDRNQAAFETMPNSVAALYAKYDGTGTTPAPKFNTGGSPGIPFLDIANRYVSAGDPLPLYNIVQSGAVTNGGPGVQAIANSVADPTSAVGKAIGSTAFISTANYISAAICTVDGMKPAAVCASPGVKAALKELAGAKLVG